MKERPVRSNSQPRDTTTRAQPLKEDKQESPGAAMECQGKLDDIIGHL